MDHRLSTYAFSQRRMEFHSKCGECGTTEGLTHKCEECRFSLCGKCKKKHAKKIGLNKHTVVKKEDHGPVKKTTCSDHPPNEYQMFCDEESCQTLVCLTCISTTHKKHQFIELKEAEDKKRAQFESMKEELITKQLAQLSKTLKDIGRNRENHKEQIEHFRTATEEHKKILEDEIERVFEEFQSEFEESRKFDETLMDEQTEQYEKRITDIKTFLEEAQHDIKACTDSSTLIHYIQSKDKEFRRKIDSEIQRTRCELPKYSPVLIERKQIRELCGNMKASTRDVIHVQGKESLSLGSFGADTVSLNSSPGEDESSLPEADTVTTTSN